MDFRVRCACIVVILSAGTARAQQRDADVSKLVRSQELSRAAFVRTVLRVHPSIAGARANWRAMLARERQAGALDDPMLEASIAPLSIGASRVGVDVGLSQSLPWFGRRALERKVMSAEAAAAAGDLESARRELALAAVTLYSQYYVALQSLEINARHVQLLTAAREAATAQVEVGRGTVQDALQADAELAHLERANIELEAARDVVIAQMNELLQREPMAALPPASTPLVDSATAQARDANALAVEAARARPEIDAARQHARAAALQEEAAGRAYYPTVTLATSYSSMWDMPEHRWMVGASINVPLPNDRRAGAIDEARAMRAKYESEIARMSATARTQVYVALRGLAASEQQLLLLQRRLLPLARQRIDAAQAEFAASKAPFVAVIEAERSLRGLELDHKQAQAEHARRRAELDGVVGRVPGLDASGDGP